MNYRDNLTNTTETDTPKPT